MQIKHIYTSLFLLVIFTVSLYFWGIVWVARLGLSILLYSVVFYIFYVWWKKLRWKKYQVYWEYLPYFLYKIANITLLLVAILWSFLVYENEISPATMHLYTLTNGEKTVKFQEMIHIGSTWFYNWVQNSLRSAKSNWFVLYYEEVKPWTQENMNKFNQAIGIKFEKDLYKNFSRLYGVTFQNNQNFLWVVNNLDYNVDISIDDVMQLYELEEHHEKTPPENVEDINKTLLEELSKIDDVSLKILIYVNQWILNFMIKSDTLKDTLMNEFWNKALFDVILHKRNEVVAKKIIQSKDQKIFVLYWQLHFQWIYELLKEKDPRWSIIQTQSFYPISESSFYQ